MQALNEIDFCSVDWAPTAGIDQSHHERRTEHSVLRNVRTRPISKCREVLDSVKTVGFMTPKAETDGKTTKDSLLSFTQALSSNAGKRKDLSQNRVELLKPDQTQSQFTSVVESSFTFIIQPQYPDHLV